VIVVLMGVAGTGKTTVGRALAAALGAAFIEGDAFHTPASRAKMAAGVPLDDSDRAPWLEALGEELARTAAAGAGAVLACSALRRRYRDRLRVVCPGLRLVHLDGAVERIHARLEARRGHYMPASLLASQIQALERPGPDEGALVFDVGTAPARALATHIARALRAGRSASARG
jgi:gluconokinase